MILSPTLFMPGDGNINYINTITFKKPNTLSK